MMLTRLIEILLCSFLFLFSAQLYAHSKVDNIRLANGNDITGEIKQLRRGKLSYGTDSMGTVGIEWEDVTAIESEFSYEIRLENGKRYYGSLARAKEEGEVLIVHAEGEQVVKAIDIIELRPIEDNVNDRLDMRLGVGYSYNKASDVATFNLTSKLGYQDEKGITSLDGRTLHTDNEGDSSDSNRYKVSREMWTSRPQVVDLPRSI